MIISLYVDDLIYTRNDVDMCFEFKEIMKQDFEMTDLGQMKFFLGIEINQSDTGIFISQQKYAKEILVRFGMKRSSTVTNPVVPGNKLTRNENGKAVDAT